MISVYPVTGRIIRQLEEVGGVSFETKLTLGELKRQSIPGVVKALRRLREETVWVTISDHNYQPNLPLLLVLAAFTRARRLRVVDFMGIAYQVTRWRVLFVEPLRMAVGTVKGFLSLCRAYREARRLLRVDEVPCRPVSGKPHIGYLKTNLWFGVQVGGSIGHVAGVANGFSQLDYDVDMYAVEGLPMLASAIRHVEITCNGTAGLPLEVINFSFQRQFVEQVARHMKTDRPGIIYQRNCLGNYAGVVLSRQFGLPLILEYNGSEVWVAEHWGTPLKFGSAAKLIEEANLRHAHVVVVVSAVLREELLARGVSEQRIVYYPNCIDPKSFDPEKVSQNDLLDLRQSWKIPPNALVCTFVGTFGPWHGADVYAEAVDQILAERQEWVEKHNVFFLFVGDGQMMPKVRRLLEHKQYGRVRLTGLVPQEQAPEYLVMSDILVSPHVPNSDGSRFFGSPTKLFEYMAMGKGIVASELEQIGEVLKPALRSSHLPERRPGSEDHQLAVLVEPGNVDSLMEGIRFLVERRDWRETLGNNARAEALAKYTWKHHVNAILEGLEKVCPSQ
jgi:glycosyltransferase involved in cell wall biosynthesis